jgi:hypothetical protein
MARMAHRKLSIVVSRGYRALLGVSVVTHDSDANPNGKGAAFK